MPNISIDKEKCIGCGTCVATCPKVFKLGDDGKSSVIDPEGDTPENIQKAVDNCPVNAISLS